MTGCGRHNTRRLRKHNLALTIIKHRVITLRVMSAIDRAEESFRPATRGQARDPTVFVEIKRRTLSPFSACPLPDPWTGEAEDIDERKFRRPVGRPGQIHAHARLCSGQLRAHCRDDEQ